MNAEAAKIKYKEQQQKRNAALAVGKKDQNGFEILSVLSRTDNWVIYEVKTASLSESIRVDIDTEDEDDPDKILDKFDAIRSSFIKFKRILYKVNDYSAYRSVAAQIIAHGLSGKTHEAVKQFDELIDEISKNYVRQFEDRLTYIITALIFVLINISFSYFVFTSRCFANLKILETLVYVASAGSIGGFISISRKLKQTIFEKDIKSSWFIVYSIERIFISIFAAIVVYYAIKSDLAFGQIKKLSSPLYGYILFAFVAGFSETLVPNLLIRFEEKQK